MDEYLGSVRCIHFDTECGRVIMRAEPDKRVRTGDEIRLQFDAEHIRLFDAVSGAAL